MLSAADMALFEAVKSLAPDRVQSALASGADVNARDEAEFSPLIYAVKADNIDIVSLLVEKGADLTANYGEPDDPIYLFHYTNRRFRHWGKGENQYSVGAFLWRSFQENVLQKRPLTAVETRALLDAYSYVDGHAAFLLKDGTLREGYFYVDEDSDDIIFSWAPSPLNPASFDDDSEERIPFADIDLESLHW